MIDFANLPQTIAIVGSRDFPKLSWVFSFVKKLDTGTVIVSGGARGVDTAAEQAAEQYGMRFKGFKVESFEWDIYGKREGVLRNGHIIKYVKEHDGIVVLFHCIDSKTGVMTKGTSDMVARCLRENIKYILVSETGEIAGNYS